MRPIYSIDYRLNGTSVECEGRIIYWKIYSARQGVSSIFTKLHGQKAVINQLVEYHGKKTIFSTKQVMEKKCCSTKFAQGS